MEQNKPSKAKRIITNIVLVFMLIIFPAMSWFYLDRGADFYRGMMADLGNYGEMPQFNLKNTSGDLIDEKKFDKKLSVINFASPIEDKEGYEGMKRVYDQFKDNSEVLFATMDSGKLDSISFGSQILEQGINPDKWSFLYGEDSIIQDLKTNQFTMNDSLQQLVGNIDRALVLVDTNNIIRNYFLSTDSIQTNRMITIMSVLMPRDEKASIKFEREKEK